MSYRFVMPFADVGLGIKTASGATLNFFDQGTSTPKIVYSDFALGTAIGTVVTADANGLFPDIFLDIQADVSLIDGNSVPVWGPETVYAPDDSISALPASAITIVDPGGEYVATEVESALLEIWNILRSTSGTSGANKIGIEDVLGNIDAATVEGALSELAANQVLTQTKFKPVSESRTVDTTLSDDTHLAGFTHTDGRIYSIEGYLNYIPVDIGQFKCALQFSVAPGATSKVTYSAADAIGASQFVARTPIDGEATITGLTTALESSIRMSGVFISNGGTLDFQWAQNTSDFNSTVLNAGSYITIKDIGAE